MIVIFLSLFIFLLIQQTRFILFAGYILRIIRENNLQYARRTSFRTRKLVRRADSGIIIKLTAFVFSYFVITVIHYSF